MKRYTKIYYKNLLLSFRFCNLIAIWNAELKKSVWIVSVFSVWRWSWDLISHWLGVWIYYVLKNQNSLIKKFAQLVLKACSLVTPEEFIYEICDHILAFLQNHVYILHMLITIFEMITWKTTYGEIQARTSSGKAGELSNDMGTSPSPDICDTIKNDSLSLFPMNFHFVTHKSSVPLKKKLKSQIKRKEEQFCQRLKEMPAKMLRKN